MNTQAVVAIFKRNLFAYFGSPTGYVFICAFVLVSGLAAFWPHEFFNSNLANLDQLNKVIHLILLGFIPAITMSIWADERRQGTDELLLTLPASDLEVVVGKYLAAVSIYTVSLVFSLSNLIVLSLLGDPDPGLMFSTYLGYWFMGLTMLAIGMVASFLTGNLTVAFVLGVAFNVPLVLAGSSDVFISSSELTQSIREWSLHAQFQDFSRGVVSLSSLIYFGAAISAMLYLSSVLIGRRHWATGGTGQMVAGHYFIRVVSLMVAAASLSFAARNRDVRADFSTEKLSSLSQQSVSLLKGLGDRQIRIEAFVSPEGETPEGYIQTRLNLLTMLDELRKQSGGRIAVTVHETETFKPEATVAERRYGITAQTRFTRDRGKFKESRLYLGVAIISGLDKEVIPFVDRGVPVEYELVRSIVAVSKDTVLAELKDKKSKKDAELTKAKTDKKADLVETLQKEAGEISGELAGAKRKVLGIIKTDADLMGNQNSGRQGQFHQVDHPLVAELRKQYELKEVDPEQPILWKDPFGGGSVDAFIAAQPSNISPSGMTNLLALIRQGAPVALFEDPEAITNGRVAGTREPRRPVQPPQIPGMRMPQQRPTFPPKGDVNDMWGLLGVSSLSAEKRRDMTALEVRDELWRMATLNLPSNTRRGEILGQFGGLRENLESAVENQVPRSDPDDPNPESYAIREEKMQQVENQLIRQQLIQRYPKGSPERKLFEELLEIGKAELAKKMLQARAGRVSDQLGKLRDDAHQTRNTHILWHRYNPFPKLASFGDEFIFIGNDAGGAEPAFNPDHDISSGLQHLLLLHSGALHWQEETGLKYEPLVRTGDQSGTTDLSSMFTSGPLGMRMRNPNPKREQTEGQFVVAVHITGTPVMKSAATDQATLAKDLVAIVGDEEKIGYLNKSLLKRDGAAASTVGEWFDSAPDMGKFAGDLNSTLLAGAKIEELESSISSLNQILRLHKKPLAAAMQDSNTTDLKSALTASQPINVVLVSDMDLFAPDFFRIRTAGGINADMGLDLDVDNVSFVLNIVDFLAGDDRFLEIRKKRRLHRTLTSFEKRIQAVRKQTRDMREGFEKEYEESIELAREELQEKQKEVYQQAQRASIGGQGLMILSTQQRDQLETAEEQVNRALNVKKVQLERKRDEGIKKAEDDLEQAIRARQNKLKRMAVFLPPLLPFFLGLGVWVSRMSRELAGVNEARLRNQ